MTELGEPGRLARLVAHPRKKFIVPIIWAVLLVPSVLVAFVIDGGLTKAQENDVSAWLPADAESTKAIEPIGVGWNVGWALCQVEAPVVE